MSAKKKESSKINTPKKEKKPSKPKNVNRPTELYDKKPHKKSKLAAKIIGPLLVMLLAFLGVNGIGTGSGDSRKVPSQESGSGDNITPSESEPDKEVIVITVAAKETETPEVPSVTIVEISINEDGYIYKNQKCSLNEIFDDISEWDEIHFTVKNASEDDVLALQNMAKERDIKIVETS